MKVRKTINIRNANREIVTLMPGDDIPEWAEELITNPKVLWPDAVPELEEGRGPDQTGAASSQGEDGDDSPYAGLKKPELQAALKERDLPTSGSVAELRERLTAADAAAGEPEEIDLWSMDAGELKKLAAQRGIDVGEASNTNELAAVLEQALGE